LQGSLPINIYQAPPQGSLDLEALARDVRAHPDAYQYERAQRFGVTQKAIWQALRRLRVTYSQTTRY